jgi:hypothetical protein
MTEPKASRPDIPEYTDAGGIYSVRPRVAFGFTEYELSGSATRWAFQ